MRRILLLLALPVQLLAQHKLPEEKYLCIISADKEIYRPGEMPRFIVEIKNNSTEPLLLAKVLDGSDLKWRFPYAFFTITRIGDTSYTTQFPGRCGNLDDIRPDDFVEVKPNSTFYPYQVHFPTRPDNIYAYDYKFVDPVNFSQPGQYLVRFYYSTREDDFKNWRGRFYGREPDPVVYQNMLYLFSKRSKLELVSNKLIIEVQE